MRVRMMMNILLVVWATGGLLLHAAPIAGVALEPVDVRLADGTAEGYYDASSACFVFKGIPYAAPPIGPLRFADPQPVRPWSGKLNASAFSPGCMQSCQQRDLPLANGCPLSTSEDCLYLNVFTPSLSNASSLLPVVVWIHGGDYTTGSGGVMMFDSPRWASSRNIVLVTINYRLGVFGGMYLPQLGLRGNFQTKDQQAALKWVQTNIRFLGGDPSRVTIDGQSAGAISVSVHLAVPSSWPLFHRAIVQSNPYGVLALNPSLAASLSGEVATAVACGSPNATDNALSCLRGVSAEALLFAQDTSIIPPWPWQILQDTVQWMPVVEEGGFLPVQPLFATQNASSFPPGNISVMIGNTLNETLGFISPLMGVPVSYEVLKLFLDAIFGESIATEIIAVYGGTNRISNNSSTENWLVFSEMASDYLFFCPTRYAAAGLAQNGARVSHYVYTHVPSYGAYFNGDGSPCNSAVCHAIELPELFNNWYECENISSNTTMVTPSCPNPSASEVALGDAMEEYWSNFAFSGSPNIGPTNSKNAVTSELPTWPVYLAASAGQRMSLNISTQLKAVGDFKGRVCDFFDSIGYNRR